jgi:hypothetical protein
MVFILAVRMRKINDSIRKIDLCKFVKKTVVINWLICVTMIGISNLEQINRIYEWNSMGLECQQKADNDDL